LRAVWGRARNDVWAVGDHGTALRWDGRIWRAVPTGTAEPLFAVSGGAEGTVWIAGAHGALLEWRDGALHRWVPGEGSALRREPVTGSEVEPAPAGPELWRDLWTSPTGEVIVVGGERGARGEAGKDEETSRQALLRRFDGSAWTEVEDLEAAPLDAVSAHEGGRVLASGPGVVFEWRRGRWRKHLAARGRLEPALRALAERGPRPDRVGVMDAEGHFWPTPAPPAPGPRIVVRDLHEIAPGDRWAVGDHGALFHFDGARWSGHGLGDPAALTLWPHQEAALLSLWSDGAAAAVAVGARYGSGVVLARVDGRWRSVGEQVGAGLPGLYAVSGASARETWIAGDRGTLLKYDGDRLQRVTIEAGLTADLTAVLALGPADVWVGGGGATYHFDGAAWTRHELPGEKPALVALAGRPGEVWALRPLARFREGAWAPWEGDDLPGELRRLAWLGPEELVVDGLGAARIQGGRAAPLAWPGGVQPTGLASSAGALWAVGGRVARRSGAGWAVEDPGTPRLLRLHAGADGLWAAGEGLTILRRRSDAP
jgi:hypothetical protein